MGEAIAYICIGLFIGFWVGFAVKKPWLKWDVRRPKSNVTLSVSSLVPDWIKPGVIVEITEADEKNKVMTFKVLRSYDEVMGG